MACACCSAVGGVGEVRGAEGKSALTGGDAGIGPATIGAGAAVGVAVGVAVAVVVGVAVGVAVVVGVAVGVAVAVAVGVAVAVDCASPKGEVGRSGSARY